MPDQHREWTEEIRVAGARAIERIKELIREGNVRKIIVKKADGEILREIPLSRGAAIGGLLVILAPTLAALGALVALLAEVRIEVVRQDTGSDPS